MSNETSTAIALQKNYKSDADSYLSLRGSDNPEFKVQFIKTFSDLIFSQNDEMLEKLSKTKSNSLLNAIFRATESGASFAKKEISFIPFEIFRKEKSNGVDRKVATGEYEALVIFDINFQKQQILKLANCKNFFTREVHEGVQIIMDLNTGLYQFEGVNDVTKPTIGYYACFISTDNVIYPKFMTNAEIIERAKFSPQFKESNYKNTGNSIHFEKIVVRNLIKEIPKLSNELKSVLAWDESSEFTTYEDVTHDNKNALEAAKKELATPKGDIIGKIVTNEDIEKIVNPQSETKNEPSVKTDAQSFF